MTTRERWLLLVGAAVVLAAVAWHWTRPATPGARGPVSAPPQASAFSRAEVHRFLAAAQQAETIADPLQRCLDYPDPPGSHWSRIAVEAYCRYRFQPVLSFTQVRSLVESGRAAQLDQRLAAALQAQRAQAASRGLLDRIYHDDFEDGGSEVRPLLDAWKRQSPQSAFAYAASGLAYVAMAQKVRGTAFAGATPQNQFDSMDRLLVQATGDLDHAVHLDPRVTPTYWGMIYAGGLGNGAKYAVAAANRGLAVDPANFSIYRQLLWLAQPQWAGSVAMMQKITASAQQHAKANPSLSLLLPWAPAVAANLENCGCRTSAQLADARRILDTAAPYRLLRNVGRALSNAGHPGAGAIYLSEALRFDPALVHVVTHRSDDLADLGDANWARAEANRAIAMAPHDAVTYETRAYVHKSMHDYRAEEQDCRLALAIAPDDAWTLKELGSIYVYTTHEWDKGWDVTSQLIQMHPDNPAGWVLRASIQKDEPRPGENDTIKYFLTHFGDDPSEQVVVAQMRARMAREASR